MHKFLLPIFVSAVVLAGAGCSPNPPPSQNPAIVPEVVTNTNAPATGAETKTNGNTNNSSNTNTSAGTSGTPGADAYTMDQVAAHKDEGDCWTAIRGKVYDLTGWIAKHPGGPQNIIKLCGTDGTDFFVGQHAGSPPQENRLAEYEIGTVKQ